LKRIADPKKRIERRIPWICFQGADERLAQTRLLGQRNAGNALSFPLRHEKLYDFRADLVSDVFFGHAFRLVEKPLDNEYHYNDNAACFCDS
jgi:hypothetical protein